MKIKNIQSDISLKNASKKVTDFIYKKESLIVFFILFIFIGYVAYLWYQYAYSYQWSDATKQEYISAKSEANSFNKEKFEKVLGDINARQESYQKNVENVKDIFKLNN